MQQQELELILTKLKQDVNEQIAPWELVKLIEEVGGLIDDLDMEVIELEQKMNLAWHTIEKYNPEWPKVKVTMEQKTTGAYLEFKQQSALLKRLRRHYRVLNTKLNLITKPKGR